MGCHILLQTPLLHIMCPRLFEICYHWVTVFFSFLRDVALQASSAQEGYTRQYLHCTWLEAYHDFKFWLSFLFMSCAPTAFSMTFYFLFSITYLVCALYFIQTRTEFPNFEIRAQGYPCAGISNFNSRIIQVLQSRSFKKKS